MALLLYGVHYPNPEKENILIDAMHKFAEAVKKEAGVIFVDTFKNPTDGTIISVAVWDSKQAFQSSWSELVKKAPSQEWELKPREAFMMESA